MIFEFFRIPILFKFRVGLPDGKDEDIQDTDHPNNYIVGEFEYSLLVHSENYSTFQAIHL
jgi:hypothetical protein